MKDNKISERAGREGPPDTSDDLDERANDEAEHGPSLADDALALFEDAKTYAEAEVAFQKSRASYTANRLKGAIAFGLGAFGVLHLALIALTVGAVIALAPIVGPWAATGIVTVALIILGVLFLIALRGRINDIRSAFSDDSDD